MNARARGCERRRNEANKSLSGGNRKGHDFRFAAQKQTRKEEAHNRKRIGVKSAERHGKVNRGP